MRNKKVTRERVLKVCVDLNRLSEDGRRDPNITREAQQWLDDALKLMRRVSIQIKMLAQVTRR